ncbi:hypothetical protein C8R46DRAFT_1227785 [Mycena filopes]|nr:hypothetical protein C8R46DRAFT_1227785 [Mycena filopes]
MKWPTLGKTWVLTGQVLIQVVAHIKAAIRIPVVRKTSKPASKGGENGKVRVVEKIVERVVQVQVPVSVPNPEEGWDDDTEEQAVVKAYPGDEDVTRRIAFTAKMFAPSAAANNEWFFQKTLGDGDFIAAGQIVIPPNGRKPRKSSKDNTFLYCIANDYAPSQIFFVIEGAVNLKVCETSLIVASGGMFMIPRGNKYLIENVGERDAKLFFTQARKIREGEEDEGAVVSDRSEDGPMARAASVAAGEVQGKEEDVSSRARALLSLPRAREPQIKWNTCPDDTSFLCSFLDVPLDYSDEASEDYATLAIRLYPATVPPSQRLGTIFTNPGGPGSSGHALLLKTGPALSTIFHGKFDIVSWDPRGVNMSTPRISCHPTELHRQLFSLQHNNNNGDMDFDTSTPNITLLTASARAELLTELCRFNVGDKVLRSVTTVNVARDLEQLRKAIGEGDLLYWGFSYGTTLGATYAAMFPEHVQRMVLDGVVYTPEQYSSLLEHGMSSGDSTSKVFDGFVSSCIAAGPTRCSLIKDRHMDASQLKQHILNLLNRLRVSPVPVVHPPSNKVPSILRPLDLLLPIFAALLRPANWATVASAIADLDSHGDGRAIAALGGAGGSAQLDLRNQTDGERAKDAGWGRGRGRSMGLAANEAAIAVSCGDAPPFAVVGDAAGWTQEWLDWREQLVSSDFINIGVVFNLRLRGTRASGGWGMIYGHRSIQSFSCPTHMQVDPVSPISSGRRMVEVFGSNNSRLVENHAYGQPSLCIARAIREYMIEGTLPEEGTVCEPEDGTIFPDMNPEHTFEGEGGLVVQALHELSRAMFS